MNFMKFAYRETSTLTCSTNKTFQMSKNNFNFILHLLIIIDRNFNPDKQYIADDIIWNKMNERFQDAR